MRAITDVELMRIDDHLLDIMLTWDQLTAQAGSTPSAAGEQTDWRLMSGAFRLETLTAGVLSQNCRRPTSTPCSSVSNGSR